MERASQVRQQAASRIVMPDELQVTIDGKDGPWASPVVAALAVPGGLKILAVGGLTKEEQIGATVYAALLAMSGMGIGATPQNRAEKAAFALLAAKDFLAVSADARKQHAAEQPLPPAEETAEAESESHIFVPGQ